MSANYLIGRRVSDGCSGLEGRVVSISTYRGGFRALVEADDGELTSLNVDGCRVLPLGKNQAESFQEGFVKVRRALEQLLGPAKAVLKGERGRRETELGRQVECAIKALRETQSIRERIE